MSQVAPSRFDPAPVVVVILRAVLHAASQLFGVNESSPHSRLFGSPSLPHSTRREFDPATSMAKFYSPCLNGTATMPYMLIARDEPSPFRPNVIVPAFGTVIFQTERVRSMLLPAPTSSMFSPPAR